MTDKQTCSRKITYRTAEEAERHAKLEQERRLFARPLYAYRCPVGDHYHLSHKRPRRTR